MTDGKVGRVVATAVSEEHVFSKDSRPSITLIKGIGVEGDCHADEAVQHRSRMYIKPAPPNLRQVHLISQEKLSELDLQPGEIGENISISGIDLLFLSKGTQLHFVDAESEGQEMSSDHPVVVLQGLRNPCHQIDKYRKGLQEKFIVRDVDGEIIKRLAGIKGTVELGGIIRPGFKVVVEAPIEHEALGCV